MKTQLIKSLLVFLILNSTCFIQSNAQIVNIEENNSYKNITDDDETATVVSCNCSLPGYGCLSGQTGCLMACALQCRACTIGATITANDTLAFCAGDSVTLTASRLGGTIFQWLNDTVIITGATAHTYTAFASGSYKCRITNNCNTKTSAAKIVTVLPLPLANVVANAATIFCYGSSVTLTADSAPGYTFKWMKNGNNILNGTLRSYKVTASGNYSVAVSNMCGTSVSIAISCTRILNPTPLITTSDPLTYCANQTINSTFTANTFPGVSYQWQKSGVNINGAIAESYTAITTGKFRVKETANGCSRNSSTKSITVNCRLQDENIFEWNVYPNPATNSVTIKFPSDEPGEISIVNLFGQIVFSDKINSKETQIDVSRFAVGIYVVRYNSGEMNETKTFSVIK